jgi:VPS28 protein
VPASACGTVGDELLWSVSEDATRALRSFKRARLMLSLDEDARLYTTNAERERYESLATLYGIVVALDHLERAYVRDSVTAAECVVNLTLWVAR